MPYPKNRARVAVALEYICEGCGKRFSRYKKPSHPTPRFCVANCQRVNLARSEESRAASRMRMSVVIAARTTHGESDKSPEYNCWKNIKSRVAKGSRWNDWYFARGIGVCPDWMRSFDRFLSDVGRRPSAEHSLDRIDNDRGYEPGNCRWATRAEQMRNRTSNRVIEARGETKTLGEWATISGVKRETIARRLNVGWEPERAIFEYPGGAI